MSRMKSLALAGTAAMALGAGLIGSAQAAPLPAATSAAIAGAPATVDQVRYYGGYRGYGYRGYGYRHYGYRRNVGGALAAGAALGLIGGAIAASAAPSYGYYGYPAYGYYGYPAYGYPAYGYPAYGYYGY